MSKQSANPFDIKAESFFNLAGVIFVVLDDKGTVRRINEKGCEILGYFEKEIVGKNWFDHFLPQRNRKEVETVFQQLTAGKIKPVEYYENPILSKNGQERIIIWHNSILKDGENNIIGTLGAGEDITERKKAEEKIEQNLREKEVLLREIHHRVKNNLTVITSLLNLQAHQIKNKQQAIEAFKESRNRVFSMALVHEKLYKSENFANVDMKDYIESISRNLLQSVASKAEVTLSVDIQDVLLDVNHAIPCGLILNELITNAAKHAFPNRRKGHIQICFKEAKHAYELTVRDDGVGLADDFDIEKVDSLGLQIVALLTKQLDGEIKIKGEKGAAFHITFPVSES